MTQNAIDGGFQAIRPLHWISLNRKRYIASWVKLNSGAVTMTPFDRIFDNGWHGGSSLERVYAHIQAQIDPIANTIKGFQVA